MVDGNSEQVRIVAEQVVDTAILRFVEKNPTMSKKLTLTEIGVIASLLTSICVAVFTLGVVYGQVQRNTADIATIKPKVEATAERIERIDANVEWLRQREIDRAPE